VSKRSRLAAAAIALSGLGAGVAGTMMPSAHATAVVGELQFAGTDRYDTARLIATYKSGASYAFGSPATGIVASGDNFPDALSANFIAGSLGSPIFLTSAGSLSPQALSGIEALGIKSVVIVGGPAAVSTAVDASLNADGISTRRIEGSDRDATAELVAEASGTSVGSYNGDGLTALLAADDADHYVDALSGGPMSWAGHLPLLLTPGDALAASAASALQTLGIKHVVILGGTGAVSLAVEQSVQGLGITTERLQGSDRQQTAIAIAQAEQDHLGFSSSHYDLARGDAFPDALAGGPLGGLLKAPTLLTVDPDALGADTQTFLNDNDGSINELFAFGGPGAIAPAVLAQAVSATTCSTAAAGATTTTAAAGATTTTAVTSTTLSTSSTTTILSATTTSVPPCNSPASSSSTSSTSSSLSSTSSTTPGGASSTTGAPTPTVTTPTTFGTSTTT
jgi:putative cell wall-binding protein